jgi:hypothetical protein
MLQNVAESESESTAILEGPSDLQGSEEWFKSLEPRTLPFLAVMPSAEVCCSPCGAGVGCALAFMQCMQCMQA